MQGYIGYIRVSTTRQGQGVSLPVQKEAILRYAERNQYPVGLWLEEMETAAKRGRPIFNQAMKLLRQGKYRGMILHKLDRGARNLKDWAEIGELSDQGIEVHFVSESLDLQSRGGRLSADIQAVVSADYIRNLREETRKGFYGRLKQGLYPLQAPLGYLDNGKGKVKTIDPVKGPLVRKAFELYATARYNLATLGDELYRLGLRSHSEGRVSRSGLSHLLNNPFFMGIIRIRRTGENFVGIHEQLISKTIFDRVQKVLTGKVNVRTQRHTFLFRRMLSCATCGYSLIVSALKGIWRDSWGPRLEYILYNAVTALLECRNVTLLGVNRMLIDEKYRTQIIRQIKDPFIRSFWAEEYAGYDERFKREAIAPIQNKLGQFLLSPVIRNILGQVKTKVNIPWIMDNERLFIANLSKGRIGEDKANLLGSLLTTQFQLGAMERANQPEDERRAFYLFIDEFQNFSTDTFASILAEARKYCLCLILSHQYIDQLSLPVRQAVFGNVGTVITFRIGHTDAEVMEKEFGGTFSSHMLADLNRYEAVVKLLEDGTSRQPFLAKMLPPFQHDVGRKEKLIARSRERFATPRAVVEEKLNRWMNGRSEQTRFAGSDKS